MVRTFSWILLWFAIVSASQEDLALDVFVQSSDIFGHLNGQSLRGSRRRALDGVCKCNNPDYPCQNNFGGCWPLPTKEGCEVRNNGLLCEAQPCTFKGCKRCTLDGKSCVDCKENHVKFSDSCVSFDELFSDVSDSSFTLSGNLVLLSSEKIAQALSDGFAMVPGKSRPDAVKHAIAAFFQHFKDEFDAVAVFPSTKLSGYSTSTHYSLEPDYTGAPKKLRSGIIHDMHTGYSTIPFKHELLHRFGVFNKLVPKMLGKTTSVYSHWGLTAVGNARGQLGGWPRSVVECTNGQKPDKATGCPNGKLRFPTDQGNPGASNDNNPMSEFELLMAGLINPDQVSGDLIVCDTETSNIPKGGEMVEENGKKYFVGDCTGGINFVTPAELEANWQLYDSDNVRLQPRGKSDPNLRVVALVVYKSDADVAEALSTGAQGESDLRDAKQWLDGYLNTVRESWGTDTTVDGKQLSSLSFPVAECDRIGKPSCVAPAPPTTVTNKNPTPSSDEETKAGDQSIKTTKTGDQLIETTQESNQSIKTTKAGNQPIRTTKAGDQPIRTTKSGNQAVTGNTGESTTSMYFSSSLRLTPTFTLLVFGYLLF